MKLLKGDIVHAPALGALETIPDGALLLDDDGTICEVLHEQPQDFDGEVFDCTGKLIMQSFADIHLHAPQFPNVGTGMDLPLLDWLKAYTFPVEAKFADLSYARRVYRRLARDLIANGTTRVCMFSSLHTDATLVLMEELERAGVTGFVGKVNMDRNGGENLQETTEESIRETLRWLAECSRFTRIKPILTPRFTPACTDELMAALGKISAEKGLYVQSHLSENLDEIAWVRELHPDCAQYWESYDKFGLWKDRTIMAHCVHSDARERSAIRQAGVVVAHCPDSNINLCSGIAPVRQMLNEGLWVTLGSDIAAGSSLSGSQMVTMSIQDPPLYRPGKAGFSDRSRGVLPRHDIRPPLFRRRKRLRRRRPAARRCGRRPRFYGNAAGAQPVRAPRARAVHDDRHERLRGMVGGPSGARPPHGRTRPENRRPLAKTRMISAPFYGILSAG